jgi:hypothetical protein
MPESENLSGDKLYQKRAREALPLLVRQAWAHSKIYYSDLALELEMPNPRNLNYVLGSIGQALKDLSREWEEEIPPIQCLVVNKRTELPGEGLGWLFNHKQDWHKLPLKQRREILQIKLQTVFVYPRWLEVLKRFGLSMHGTDYSEALRQASKFRAVGESKRHKELKIYIAKHPEILGLPATSGAGEIEFPLPSGDRLDVLFKRKEEWIAVEVKSAVSSVSDIVRGVFQCLKYRTILEACQTVQGLPQSARSVLVTEKEFPEELIPIKHMLEINVVDCVGYAGNGQ